jgi:hypothetical protein
MAQVYMDLVLEAVHDAEWQKFRLSLKGIPTKEKLHRLLDYDNETQALKDTIEVFKYRHRLIRVDNYLKALARGGQIGVSNHYMSDLREGKLTIRK